MAYTFDYDYISAVIAFLNGDQLSELEKETLIALADVIQTEAKEGFPEPDFDDIDFNDEEN